MDIALRKLLQPTPELIRRNGQDKQRNLASSTKVDLILELIPRSDNWFCVGSLWSLLNVYDFAIIRQVFVFICSYLYLFVLLDSCLDLSYFVRMKTRATKSIGGSTGGTLAHNIGLRCPREMKLVIEKMSKLLDRSENSIIIECVMAVDEMARSLSDSNHPPKMVFMLRQAMAYMSKKAG